MVKWEVYLRGTEYTKKTKELTLEKRKDKLYKATGKIYGFSEAEYNALTKSDQLTIRSVNAEEMSFQGEMTKVDWDSLTHTLTFVAYNFPNKLNNHVWEKTAQEWINTEFEDIFEAIIEDYQWASLTTSIQSSDLAHLVMNFRIENEPIWTAIARLLKQAGATWRAWPAGFNSTSKQFQFEYLYLGYEFHDRTLALTTSDYITAQRTKKYDQIINFVTVLGRGDGINQLKSVNFHAATARPKLTIDLTESGSWVGSTYYPKRIYVNSVAGFPSGDYHNIRIGHENIHIKETNNDGNYFEWEQETVGADARRAPYTIDEDSTKEYLQATTPYYHRKGIQAYSMQYPPTRGGAQSGSSIATYDVISDVYSDKTIIDQPTLDFLAQRIIDEYNDVPEIITLETKYIDNLNLHVGDHFTVGGTDFECSEYLYSDQNLRTKIVGGASFNPLLDEIQDMRRNIDIEAVYGAGATNIYQIGPIEENIDEDYPFTFNVYIPSEAVAINKVRLEVQAKAWRSYQKIGTSSASRTSTYSWTSPVRTTTYKDMWPNTDPISYNDWGKNTTSQDIVNDALQWSVPDAIGMWIIYAITNMNVDSSISNLSYRIYCDSCGTVFKSQTFNIEAAHKNAGWVYVAGSTHVGHRLILEITPQLSESNKCILGELTRLIEDQHQHTIEADAFTHSHSMSHTHNVEMGIYTSAASALKLEIKKAGTSQWVTPSGWDSFTSKSEDLADYFSAGTNMVRISTASSVEGTLSRFQMDGFLVCYIRSVP